jgi:DNA mismatch repair protein MutS
VSNKKNMLYPTLLRSDSITPPALSDLKPTATGEGVLDESTFRTIEVEKLFEALNETATRIGQVTLYRSLLQPLQSRDDIVARQDALRELAQHEALRLGLEQLLAQAATLENDFYNLLYGTFLGLTGASANPLEMGGYGYESYVKGTRFMLDLVTAAENLPPAQSDYLNNLIADIRGFVRSRAYALMQGPVYRSEKSVLSKAEKRWYIPAVRFRPSMFKPVALLATLVLILLAVQFLPFALEIAAAVTPVFWLFLLPLSMIYVPIVGSFDRDACIYPLRDIYKRSSELQETLDSLGKLDELIGFHRYAQAFKHPLVLPDIVQAEAHQFELSGVRNPVLGKNNPDYVGNDLVLTQERLTFVTGPNSGGKTAFCKTLAQTQLLAQIGCYVPAERAVLTVADRIFYQVPEISHLSDGEGRFGTELKRTREIFIAASSQSLVIMDELSEGTTHEEKIEISTDILNGFRQKRCSTFLITHNHELVVHFQQQHIGQARQAEFSQDRPTYRIVPGISTVSHADRVARKIGFSREDIANLLKVG